MIKLTEKGMLIMKKCEYCAKEISYYDQYCSDECQIKANKHYELSDKFAKIFLVINVIGVFGIPVGLFLMSISKYVGAVVASGSCVLLGIMLIFLPFPTESMIKKFKIKKAMTITRIVGIAVVALGCAIAGMITFLT